MHNSTKDESSALNNQEISAQELEELKEIQSQMYQFLEERFCNNLETFKKYYPDIAEIFGAYTPAKVLNSSVLKMVFLT